MKKPFFSLTETYILKGIALIMMFIHHFFTFPSWWGEGINYPILRQLAPFFCQPLKLCVAVFCFITGYTYFFQERKTYQYSIRKITDFLVSYWIVFLFFALIAALNGYQYSAIEFVWELFALQRPTMVFCWYVYFYILSMLLLPVIVKALSKGAHFDLFTAVIVIPFVSYAAACLASDYGIICEMFYSLASWLSILLTGYIFAEYSVFERINNLFNSFHSKALQITIWSLVAVIIPFGRYFVPEAKIPISELPFVHIQATFWISFDILYAPIFIFAVISLCRALTLKWLDKCLSEIGKKSMLMWFLSCAFYNNVSGIFQPILYAPHFPVLVLLWGLILCYIFSAILNRIIHWINSVKNDVFFQKL